MGHAGFISSTVVTPNPKFSDPAIPEAFGVGQDELRVGGLHPQLLRAGRRSKIIIALFFACVCGFLGDRVFKEVLVNV